MVRRCFLCLAGPRVRHDLVALIAGFSYLITGFGAPRRPSLAPYTCPGQNASTFVRERTLMRFFGPYISTHRERERERSPLARQLERLFILFPHPSISTAYVFLSSLVKVAQEGFSKKNLPSSARQDSHFGSVPNEPAKRYILLYIYIYSIRWMERRRIKADVSRVYPCE